MFCINEGPLLAHYTAITCSWSVGIGAGIGEIITDTVTKPIQAVSADTRYRYRSQPISDKINNFNIPLVSARVPVMYVMEQSCLYIHTYIHTYIHSLYIHV